MLIAHSPLLTSHRKSVVPISQGDAIGLYMVEPFRLIAHISLSRGRLYPNPKAMPLGCICQSPSGSSLTSHISLSRGRLYPNPKAMPLGYICQSPSGSSLTSHILYLTSHCTPTDDYDCSLIFVNHRGAMVQKNTVSASGQMLKMKK